MDKKVGLLGFGTWGVYDPWKPARKRGSHRSLTFNGRRINPAPRVSFLFLFQEI